LSLAPFAWPDTGVNIHVLDPGQPASLYHSELVQEDFLVLHGECLLIADEQELSGSGISSTCRQGSRA
jgi:uncharacterized cupin superfamily protein